MPINLVAKEDMVKLRLGKAKLTILGFCLIIGVVLAVGQAQAFRFVVLADSPQCLDKWPNYNLVPQPSLTPKAGINTEMLQYLCDQIKALEPKPDLVFFLGDLVTRACYPDGEGNLRRFIPDWKEIMKTLPENGIKLYVAVGNRDLYGPEGWPPQKEWESEFQTFFSDPPNYDLPDNGPASYKKLAYSFSYDNAFFVVLDTFGFKPDGSNWDNGLDTEQLSWFYNQAQGTGAKFKFVLAHGPAFSPSGYAGDSSLREMWQTMEQFKFSAYFCGHEHIFSRWNINKSVDPTIAWSMIQTLAGTAGAYPDDPSGIKKKENLKPARIWLGYNFVVVDVSKHHVAQKAYGVTKESGAYQIKKIDSCEIR